MNFTKLSLMSAFAAVAFSGVAAAQTSVPTGNPSPGLQWGLPDNNYNPIPVNYLTCQIEKCQTPYSQTHKNIENVHCSYNGGPGFYAEVLIDDTYLSTIKHNLSCGVFPPSVLAVSQGTLLTPYPGLCIISPLPAELIGVHKCE